MCRRELPAGDVVVIVDLGEGWQLADRGEEHGSFVAGLDDRAELVGHLGEARGVQLDLTPFGAHALLGVPSGELAGRVVGLDALLGTEGGRLAERLEAAPGWAARFALLDELLLARAARAPAAFGFEAAELHSEDDGTIGHAELRFGPSLLMLGSHRERPQEPGHGALYVFVADPDAHHALRRGRRRAGLRARRPAVWVARVPRA